MDGVRDLLDGLDRVHHARAACLDSLRALQDGIDLLRELTDNACNAVELFARLIDLLDAFADVFLLGWRV